MKKTLLVLVLLIVAANALTSFRTNANAPKLYPELEAYFKSLEPKEFSQEHLEALASLRHDIYISHMDYDDWNFIFYCSENTFRSQASQIFAQTLCYANKHRKIKLFSAGLKTGEINQRLIDYLSKIGYKVTKKERDGNTLYEVKFSDQADPVILFSKTTGDKSLPTKDVTSIVVCDIKSESECASLKTESSALNLPFQKVEPTDSDEKVQATLKDIATEMVYITKK